MPCKTQSRRFPGGSVKQDRNGEKKPVQRKLCTGFFYKLAGDSRKSAAPLSIRRFPLYHNFLLPFSHKEPCHKEYASYNPVGKHRKPDAEKRQVEPPRAAEYIA